MYLEFKTATFRGIERLVNRVCNKHQTENSYLFNRLLEKIGKTHFDYFCCKRDVIDRMVRWLMVRYVDIIKERVDDMLKNDAANVLDFLEEAFDNECVKMHFKSASTEFRDFISSIFDTIINDKRFDFKRRYRVMYRLYAFTGLSYYTITDQLVRQILDSRSCLDHQRMDDIYFHCLFIFGDKLLADEERRDLFYVVRRNIGFRKDRLYVLFKVYYGSETGIDRLYNHLAYISANLPHFSILTNNDQRMAERSLSDNICHVIKTHAKRMRDRDRSALHALLLKIYNQTFLFKKFMFRIMCVYYKRFDDWRSTISIFSDRTNVHNRSIFNALLASFSYFDDADWPVIRRMIGGKYSTNHRIYNENRREHNVYKL